MNENLITEAELAQYAPDLDTSSYTTTSGLITRASELVRNYCDVDGFIYSTVTDERDRAYINTSGELIIAPRRAPVQQGDMISIELEVGDVEQTLTLSDSGVSRYKALIDEKLIIYPSNYLIAHGTGLFAFRSKGIISKISYVGGYEVIPASLKEATVLYVRHLVTRAYNPTGAQQFSQGSYSQTMPVARLSAGQSTFSIEAQTILEAGGFVRHTP